MYWGYSPAVDFQNELLQNNNEEPLNILILGSSDARHILKTVASMYQHYPNRKIFFHAAEGSLEEISRSILLLSICFEEGLGLQEVTRYYLEILGNTLLRPATAKFLISRLRLLVDIVTNTKTCEWLNLKKLKYKHRDALEHLYKFWSLGAKENIPTSKLWDIRVRHSLESRYDYKKGAFDWDYHLVLKDRGIEHLTAHDYIFWRENGISFFWIEGEPIRCNPTLITLNEHYQPFYIGDIKNGPFFTWTSQSDKENKKLRISDVAEKHVMNVINEIHQKEPLNDDNFAAHRDPSLINGTIVIQLDNNTSEQDSWSKTDKPRNIDVKWADLSNVMITFYEMTTLFKMKEKFSNQFDCVWIGQRVSKEHRDVSDLIKQDGILLTETRQFMVNYKNEEIEEFEKELRNHAEQCKFKEIENIPKSKAMLCFQK